MKAKFRKASINDYNSISILRKQIHDYHSYHRPDFYKNKELPFPKDEFESLFESSESKIYVVESGDKIYGYAITKVLSFQSNPLIVDHKRLFIDDIIIDPENRKKGIGRFLMKKLESVCRSEGYNYLDLNVWSFNTEAIDFYRKHGMRESILRMEKYIGKKNQSHRMYK
jgi:ribosomal protein S18 acetylase RimI-like enzyme